MKKGQAALEFLMTYGWAILVVLVAIGALAYFGVLRPERLLPEKCIVATGSGLYCDDYSASGATGTVTLRLKNILADTVNVTSVNLTGTGLDCTADTTTRAILPDGIADFYVNCSLTSGEKIKADISIQFGVAGGLAKTTTGQLVTTAA